MPPSRSKRLLLHHAQELGLQGQAQVLDLVEEERAAGGQLDLARLGLAGVGEGALLVAEQLRLQQLLGDGRAVDLDEGPVAPRAAVVEPVREQVLAGAALALEQHRAAGLGQAAGHARSSSRMAGETATTPASALGRGRASPRDLQARGARPRAAPGRRTRACAA